MATSSRMVKYAYETPSNSLKVWFDNYLKSNRENLPKPLAIRKTLEMFHERLVVALDNEKLVDFDEIIQTNVDINFGHYFKGMTTSDRLRRLHVGVGSGDRWLLLIKHLTNLGEEKLVYDLTKYISCIQHDCPCDSGDDDYFDTPVIICQLIARHHLLVPFLHYMYSSDSHKTQTTTANMMRDDMDELNPKGNGYRKVKKEVLAVIQKAWMEPDEYQKLLDFLRAFNMTDALDAIDSRYKLCGPRYEKLDQSKAYPDDYIESVLKKQHTKLNDVQWWYVFRYDNPTPLKSFRRTLELIPWDKKGSDEYDELMAELDKLQ
jgi:hypothetical protein